MQSVSSNAVAQAIENHIKYKDVEIYLKDLGWTAYSTGGGGFYVNLPITDYSFSGYETFLSINLYWWTGLDCRGFYIGFDSQSPKRITILAETIASYSAASHIIARIVYI